MNVAETDLPANHLPCIARWQLTAAVTLSNRRYTKPVLFLHKWKYKNKIKLMSKIMIILKIHIPISKHSRENPICYVTKHMKINSSFNLNTTSSFHVAESSLNLNTINSLSCLVGWLTLSLAQLGAVGNIPKCSTCKTP